MAAFSMSAPKPRTIVYVDGFNFYYGVVKNTGYKWLDFERYFTCLRANDDIRKIKYFTALVEAGAHRVRQEALLNALQTRPLIETILGRFKRKRVTCMYPACNATGLGDRVFEVPEEKRTDVNIAIHMLDDAYQGYRWRYARHRAGSTLVLVRAAISIGYGGDLSATGLAGDSQAPTPGDVYNRRADL